MQETTNYNLPYPEGTDIVNLLTILPELATSVDTQMKVNQDAGIQRGTHVKSGTVNAITVPNDLADGAFFTFVASDDFTEGDSFTFNGEVIGARVPSGKALKTGAFTINQNVLCCRYNGILTIFTNQADVAVDLSLNSLSNNAIANSAVSTTFAEVQQQIGNADISGVGANIKAAINALNATDGVQNSAIEEVKSNLSDRTFNPLGNHNYDYVPMGKGWNSQGYTFLPFPNADKYNITLVSVAWYNGGSSQVDITSSCSVGYLSDTGFTLYCQSTSVVGNCVRLVINVTAK